MRILITTVQVPFVRGGAEVLAESLCERLVGAGHQAEIVALRSSAIPRNGCSTRCSPVACSTWAIRAASAWIA